MIKVFYDKDVDLEVLERRKIAIVGFLGQGQAQALNLKDSGMNVIVGELKASEAWKLAEDSGMKVTTVAEAAEWADYIVMLLPDEVQPVVYREEVEPYMTKDKVLGFWSGFNIHYRQITPAKDIDVVMAAPKGPGVIVRRFYKEGKGLPALACVEQDHSGKAWDLVLAYCRAQGWTKAGVIQATFKDETEEDLLGEQAVIGGGVIELVKAGFETLTEAGYPPELAYFETYHELKMIVDLMYEGGIPYMYSAASNTAVYGSMTRGRLVINEESRKAMKEILRDVQDGTFATEWLLENQVGRPKFNALLNREKEHPIEEVGKRVRGMMPWIKGCD